MKTKQEVIDELVNDMMDTTLNDADFLHSVIRNGWIGMEEMDDSELHDQWIIQFGEHKELPEYFTEGREND